MEGREPGAGVHTHESPPAPRTSRLGRQCDLEGGSFGSRMMRIGYDSVNCGESPSARSSVRTGICPMPQSPGASAPGLFQLRGRGHIPIPSSSSHQPHSIIPLATLSFQDLSLPPASSASPAAWPAPRGRRPVRQARRRYGPGYRPSPRPSATRTPPARALP